MPVQPDPAAPDSPRPADPNTERPKNRETDYENQKAPAGGEGPPRSATEPRGEEGSARNPYTATDPASGEPQDHPARPQGAGSGADDAAKRRPGGG